MPQAFGWHDLANPHRFRAVAARVLPWLLAAAAGFLLTGLGLGLFVAPPDYLQGESVRIMYVHVPAAWLSLAGYAGMAGAALAGRIWRHPLADLTVRAIAPVGATFALVCLVSGSLWGRPTWGTWWVWDGRLTSMLVLFLLYLGVIALAHAFDDRLRGARAAGILAIVGVVNLPVIKYSVEWWNTLHQPASIRLSGSSIHPDMLEPLLLSATGFLLLFVSIVVMRLRALIAEQRREMRQRRRAALAG
ncbi:MAG: heme ABC transporter permease [Sphingomonadaceae bacterium]|uniref:heme ABC transporter permease n=1 Tax=Thermaurantiacus sp. TaxID=2820283 RepID=UPI00298F3873|nr:heme ABC transporter permease [Thermaurantiacus sp.]MCS6986488.1 heme ABC transporter permease [Sphingomonadaceae bacterium]MDW8414251.1 heme ABC transporter permease [Thermaurantiacus sp.]